MPETRQQRPPPSGIILWMIAAFALALLSPLLSSGIKTTTIPYSQFQELLDQGKVKSVTVAGDSLTGELKEPQPGGGTTFSTQRVPPDLAGQLKEHGVEFSAAPGLGVVGVILSWVLPPLIFVGIWLLFTYFSARGAGGLGAGVLSVGKSRARLFEETEVKVKFEDVAGVDEAKAELQELVEFLRAPEAYGRLGAHIARGVLLVGPPGTGKTLLARAVAGEAGVPFYSTNGSEFVEMFVGVGAARVRDLFEQARRAAPCIIFIDELDALGRSRGASPVPGPDEKEQTLNQLLAEMDGFDRSTAVIILAATNRPEILDPALLRAGRFDRQVLVDRPDKKGRAEILRIHLANAKVAAGVDREELAALTPGFTGADLANLANEAAIVATRRGADSIIMDDFVAAIERIVGGLEKRSRLLIPRERKMVAYHEMGHALVALAIPGADPVQKVSIIPRGVGALGYTMQRPTDDRFLLSRSELIGRLTVLLGGRAAEELVFGDVSTGASDDLAKATDLARGMVERYGMDERLGPIAYDTETASFLQQQPGTFWKPRAFSEATAREIDRAVHDLVVRAHDAAIAILKVNRGQLDAGAEALLAHETLDASELPKVVLPTAA
jgi:cell division protease FtsH